MTPDRLPTTTTELRMAVSPRRGGHPRPHSPSPCSCDILRPFDFRLGTHCVHWLWTVPQTPLFVSDRRLRRYRALRPALAPVAIDSGGFSELQIHGSWRHGPSPAEYVSRARRYVEQIGTVDWIAQQDWLCEPAVRLGGRIGRLHFAGTGLTVREHQRRTVANFLRLRELGPDLPMVPVLQGWHPHEYVNCARLFRLAGVDLAAEPIVGVGSVCRRQHTHQIQDVVTAIRTEAPSISLHLFGASKQQASPGSAHRSAAQIRWRGPTQLATSHRYRAAHTAAAPAAPATPCGGADRSFSPPSAPQSRPTNAAPQACPAPYTGTRRMPEPRDRTRSPADAGADALSISALSNPVARQHSSKKDRL